MLCTAVADSLANSRVHRMLQAWRRMASTRASLRAQAHALTGQGARNGWSIAGLEAASHLEGAALPRTCTCVLRGESGIGGGSLVGAGNRPGTSNGCGRSSINDGNGCARDGGMCSDCNGRVSGGGSSVCDVCSGGGRASPRRPLQLIQRCVTRRRLHHALCEGGKYSYAAAHRDWRLMAHVWAALVLTAAGVGHAGTYAEQTDRQ